MNRFLHFLTLHFLLILSLQAQEGGRDEPPLDFSGDTIVTNTDMFEGTNPLEMTLTFNIKQYRRDKYKEGYIPVDLLLHFNDSIEVKKNVRVKSRGVFRKSHCHFAPFWLNIRKAGVQNIYLQDVNKMKVVTHCRDMSSYEIFVLKEYLAYKIYNLLTPKSFRVRLSRIKYVDTGRKNRITLGWAFIIEPEEMLADRMDATVIKNDALGMVHMRPEEMLLVAFFEYLIGNEDYSVTGRHNVKILGLPGFGSEGYTPVPYDFDYSGLVNASYAAPGETLGLSSVKERYYLGPCREDAEYLATIAHMQDLQDDIIALVAGFPYLEEKEKEKMIDYIDSFYMEIAGSRFISDRLSRTCR